MSLFLFFKLTLFLLLCMIQKKNVNIMEKKLRRSNNKMLAGVCAGIAEYLNIDPTLIRVAYVLLSIFSAGFPGIMVYIILMIVMPQDF